MALYEILSLDNIRIESDAENYNYNSFILSQDDKVIHTFFFKNTFASEIGTNVTQRLYKYPFFYRSMKDFSILHLEGIHKYAVNSTQFITIFCFSLWFIKDNSVSLFISVTGTETKCYTVQSSQVYTSSFGLTGDTRFSLDEINRAIEISDRLNLLTTTQHHFGYQEIPARLNSSNISPDYFLDYNSTDRISRAIQFLTLARTQPHLHTKISLYVPIYECLFSGDESSEVSHKVSERAAFYLGDNVTERTSIYDLLKSTYNLRSRYLHGQTLDTKKSKKYDTLDKLRKLSTDIDSLTRRLMTKVIMQDSEIFLQEDDKLNKHFKDLIFSWKNS
ncbi:hypothetical protein [Flavitalea sp.]|nr:hypothetical protein [Flavitalea sp.]